MLFYFTKGHKINLGKKYSKERRENIRKALTGRHLSEECKRKLGLAHLGSHMDFHRRLKNGL